MSLFYTGDHIDGPSRGPDSQPEPVTNLLEKVVAMSRMDHSQSPQLLEAIRSNNFHRSLFDVLCDKKGELDATERGMLMETQEARTEARQAQQQRIDDMLNECIGLTPNGQEWSPISPNTNGDDDGDRSDASVENLDEEYRLAIAEIRQRHQDHAASIAAQADAQAQHLHNILNQQRAFRPVSDADFHKAVLSIHSRFQDAEIELKKDTCEKVMLLRSRLMDARRKRRNFSKEATQILTEYFNLHLDHPYPNEEEKAELARRCRITVAQVSNWFGNKRIRFKKQQGQAGGKDEMNLTNMLEYDGQQNVMQQPLHLDNFEQPLIDERQLFLEMPHQGQQFYYDSRAGPQHGQSIEEQPPFGTVYMSSMSYLR